MSDLDKHYDKSGEEHHARAARLRLNWYQGNITKYAERAPHKGSQNADIVKVLDYATLWLENDRKGVSSGEKLSAVDRNKLGLIADRLLALTGVARESGQKARIVPGYGSVIDEEGGATRNYVNQDWHPREDANQVVARQAMVDKLKHD